MLRPAFHPSLAVPAARPTRRRGGVHLLCESVVSPLGRRLMLALLLFSIGGCNPTTSRGPSSPERPGLHLVGLTLQPKAFVSVGAVCVASGVLLLFLAARRANRGKSVPPGPGRFSESAGAPRRRHFLFACLGFVTFAAYGSWVPLDFRPLPWAEAWARFRDVLDSRPSIGSRTDWAANFFLALPIGFCGLAACVSRRRGALVNAAAALAVVGCCGLLSVAIEFSQFWFPGRSPSLNDIVAQTIGGAAGVALWLLIGDGFAGWLGSFFERRAPRQQFDWLLQAYVAGLILYSLFPLDLTISPAELWRKYREGKFRFVPFANLELTAAGCFALIGDVLLFVPVGMLAVTAFRGTGQAVRSVFRGLLLGLALAAGIEIAQMFVYSRYTDATELVAAAAGISLGAAWRRRQLTQSEDQSLSPLARRRVQTTYLLAIAAYSLFLAAFFVAPYEEIHDPERLQRRWRAFFDAPLTSLYWGSEYNAVTQVLRKGLLFAPLGYLAVRVVSLAKWNRRLRWIAIASLVSAASCLAFGIEYAQIWRDGTTANFTDVLLCTFGAAAAAALTLRIEASAHHASGKPLVRAPTDMSARYAATTSLRLAAGGWLLLAVGLLLVGFGLST